MVASSNTFEITTSETNSAGVSSFAHNHFENKSDWSDNVAELASHMEIMNQSALVSISDLKGNIIYANERFCTTSKYRLDELLNKPHNIIRHPDTSPSIFKDMWSTIGNGKVWHGELKNRAKNGSSYWVIATVAPVIGAEGKPIRYISVRYDITKQKRTEEELIQAKKRSDDELFDNIRYAKHIHSVFLSDNVSPDLSENSFLLYKAQKIVSGDFYKMERKGDKLVLVVGDSTGHGFSASYISVLTLNILARIMIFCFENPARTLKIINEELHKITRVSQEKKLMESADIIICCIDKKLSKLTYASAGMKAFIIRGGESILLEKDNCTIGEMKNENFKMTNHTIDLKKGDSLYIISDGVIHQMGGSRGKSIGFKKILLTIKESQHCSMVEQKKIMENVLLQWQGSNEQTDDITFFGIKI